MTAPIQEHIEQVAARAHAGLANMDSLAHGILKSHNTQNDTVVVEVDRGGDDAPQEWGPMPVLRSLVGGSDGAPFGEIKQLPAGMPCLIGIVSTARSLSTTADDYVLLGGYYTDTFPPPTIQTGEDLEQAADGSFNYKTKDGARQGDGAGGWRVFGNSLGAFWGGVATWLGGLNLTKGPNQQGVIREKDLHAILSLFASNLQVWAMASFQSGASSPPVPQVPACQGSTTTLAAD